MDNATLVYDYLELTREIEEKTRRLAQVRLKLRQVLSPHNGKCLTFVDAGESRVCMILNGELTLTNAVPLLFMSDLREDPEVSPAVLNAAPAPAEAA